jgi:CubicO group peptidase (beta-lactamase class C family)
VLTPSYGRGDSSVWLGDFLRDYFAPRGRYYDPQRSFYPFTPGNAYRYCNIAVSLAAFLVEAASGTAFDRWCDARIFSPLGMHDTGWHLADVDRSAVAMPYRYIAYRDLFRPYGQYGYPDYPDGELRATSTNLARHLMSFMNDGRLGGTRVLARSTVEEMRRIQFPEVARRQGIIWYTQPRGRDL